uniref:Uncharacterized protein n=1 Tax=Globisporangium ultimum (strain ATCC 200006 / CBS 805.95 / DAOM BR144) TaxID=431595 RepID=K3X0P8_GLOUD
MRSVGTWVLVVVGVVLCLVALLVTIQRRFKLSNGTTFDLDDAVFDIVGRIYTHQSNETSVSLPPKERSATTSDTCSCHPDGTPRTCYECLNVQLLSGEECMINPFGQCLCGFDVLKCMG